MAQSCMMPTSSVCRLPLRQTLRPGRVSAVVRPVTCSAHKDDQQPGALPKLLTMPLAAALAGVMLTSAVTPDEALAARSGGRVGGSAFKSAPRATPRQSAPRGGGGGGGIGGGGGSGGIRGGVRGGNTYNTYVAPPVYGGGYGYGGGALSFFPRPYFPVFGFGLPIGGFFNFVFTMFVITTIFGVIRGALSKGNNRRDDDQDWD